MPSVHGKTGTFRRGFALLLPAYFALLTAAFLLPAGRAAADDLRISTYPALTPAFDPAVPDYVVRCTNDDLVRVSVTVPEGATCSIDGGDAVTSSPGKTLTAEVELIEGQSFAVTVKAPGADSRTYYIRRLPDRFPAWTAERPGTPQSEWYLAAPSLQFGNGAPQNYPIVFDSYGVPVWWTHSELTPYEVNLLDNGHLAWSNPDGVEEHRLDGSLVHVTLALGDAFDIHEMRRLPNGNTLVIANTLVGPVDLSPYGGSKTAKVIDDIAEEIAPDGSLVWSWSAYDHLPVSETQPEWWNGWLTADRADPYHMNSVEADGDGYVMSLRHLDTVLKVDGATGGLVWKLGGVPHPESLAFVGDFFGDFGGQHDARILPDGTLTLHENGSSFGRIPRAVRYRIDPVARTATLLEQVTDPDVVGSACCGDAHKLPDGNWVMSWGGNPVITELTPEGERMFRLNFGNYFAYRVHPLPYGMLRRADLRDGMDAQFPRTAHGASVGRAGDLNRDEKTDVEDAVLALKMTVGLLPVTSGDLTAGDMDRDGAIDVTDAVTILLLSVQA